MRRLSCRVPRTAARTGVDLPKLTGSTVQEVRHRRDAADIVGDARCPCCRTPLVARMGRHGPYFPCRCPQWRGPGFSILRQQPH
jgi:hypothetical protein